MSDEGESPPLSEDEKSITPPDSPAHSHTPRSRSRSVEKDVVARSRSRTPRSRTRSRSHHRTSLSKSYGRDGGGHHSARYYSRSRSRSPRRRRNSRSRSRSYSPYKDYGRYKGANRGRGDGARYDSSYNRRDFHRSHSRSPMSSRRRHVGNREDPPTSRCLGIFGLSLYTQERDLRDVFSKYGSLDEVRIVCDAQTGRSRGFAFIYFDSSEDAKVAKERCTGIEIDGRRIRVDFSITQRAHTPTPGIYMGKPTFSSNRYGDGERERGGGGGSSYRRSPSPYYSRRRYSRSRSRSYSPRKYDYGY